MLTVWDWLRNSIFQIQQQQIIPQASCWNKKRSFGGYVRRFGNQAHDDLHDLESSKMLLALLETKVWLKSSVSDECDLCFVYKSLKFLTICCCYGKICCNFLTLRSLLFQYTYICILLLSAILRILFLFTILIWKLKKPKSLIHYTKYHSLQAVSWSLNLKIPR